MLKEGQEILVQVEKEERGNKGAALTTFLSLAGRYMVLMPNNLELVESRGALRAEREELRAAMAKPEIPEGMGVIVRTAGRQERRRTGVDLNYLLQVWHAIQTAEQDEPTPSLYQENSAVLNDHDNLRADIGDPRQGEEATRKPQPSLPQCRTTLRNLRPIVIRFRSSAVSDRKSDRDRF